MLGFSDLDDAYKFKCLETNVDENKKGIVTYYKAVARNDGRFDLYSYIDGIISEKSVIVPHSYVKSLNKDNMVSIEGAWIG